MFTMNIKMLLNTKKYFDVLECLNYQGVSKVGSQLPRFLWETCTDETSDSAGTVAKKISRMLSGLKSFRDKSSSCNNSKVSEEWKVAE